MSFFKDEKNTTINDIMYNLNVYYRVISVVAFLLILIVILIWSLTKMFILFRRIKFENYVLISAIIEVKSILV